jgi:hypothetical protein
MIDDLNEETFLIYAMKAYEKPNCIMSEFDGDLKKIKYVKRLFRRYKTTKNLKERLILNHIISLNNVFGPEATVKILFYKVDEKDYDILKTFLIYLNLLSNAVLSIRGSKIKTSDIPLELSVADILRKI